MSSTDILGIGDSISNEVDDLLHEIQAMLEAVQTVKEQVEEAEERLENLSGYWTEAYSKPEKRQQGAKSLQPLFLYNNIYLTLREITIVVAIHIHRHI